MVVRVRVPEAALVVTEGERGTGRVTEAAVRVQLAVMMAWAAVSSDDRVEVAADAEDEQG
jgi:pyridoxal biosynthesis lyase PdxS